MAKETPLPEVTQKVIKMIDVVLDKIDKEEKRPIVFMFIQDHEDNICVRGNAAEEVAIMVAMNIIKIYKSKDTNLVMEACADILRSLGINIRIEVDESKMDGPVGHA